MSASKQQVSNITKILPKYAVMTPYQVYVSQVQGCIENIRYSAAGVDYVPPQLGGIFYQRQVLNDNVVLQLTDFTVT